MSASSRAIVALMLSLWTIIAKFDANLLVCPLDKSWCSMPPSGSVIWCSLQPALTTVSLHSEVSGDGEVKDYNPFSPQRSDASTPSSLCEPCESNVLLGCWFFAASNLCRQLRLHTKRIQKAGNSIKFNKLLTCDCDLKCGSSWKVGCGGYWLLLNASKCFCCLQMAPGTVVLQMGCSGSRQRVRASSATCQSRTLAAVQTWKRLLLFLPLFSVFLNTNPRLKATGTFIRDELPIISS